MNRTSTPTQLPTLDLGAGLHDIGTVIANNAQRSPDRAVIKTPSGESRAYGELDERTNRLCNALRGIGLEPGDRIAAWMDDVPEYIELYVAAAKAGLVMVPLNVRLTPGEASFQIERTTPRALVYTVDQAEKVAELAILDGIELIAARTRAGRPSGPRDFEALIEGGAADRIAPPDREDPFMICFTSGTSGFPKGAVLTHRSVMNMAVTQFIALRIPLYGTNVQAVSISFPATIASHIMPHMVAGGTNILAAGKWESDRILDIIQRENATHTNVPIPVLPEFIECARAKPESWKSLVSVLTAGQRADPTILGEFAEVIGSRYLEGWGMTEIGGGLATATSPGDPFDPDGPEDLYASCGRAAPATMVRAVDEDRNPLPLGRDGVGELAVRCTSVCTGYWNDPEASAKALQDGWYYTGDMGAVDHTGYVYISDRRTNLIVSGGMNIYPAEIELVLDGCPGVEEVAVVGASHSRWGQTPVAVVVAKKGTDLDEAAVIEYSRQNLASYKKPTRVLFVDELPRTTGQKIARGQLKETIKPLLDAE